MSDPITKCPVPRFRAARLEAGMTQHDAAQRIGRTPSAVQKWETGENSPTMADIYRLATVYGITPASFFVGAVDEATDVTTLHYRINRLERAIRAALRGLDRVVVDLEQALDDE